MFWLYLTLFSNFLFAVVFVLDKILIKKVFSPLKYALFIGGLEGLAAVLIPFTDFTLPEKLIILAALLSGASFILGIYFYFKALLNNETTWAAPLLYGVFAPVIVLILSYSFLGEKLTFFQLIAFIFLIFGGAVLSLSRRHPVSSVFYLIIAGIFISFDLFFLKIVFNHANFITGYVLSRIGGFLTAAVVLFFIHKKIFNAANFFQLKIDWRKIKKFVFGAGGLIILKSLLAFAANIVLIYAISIGNLALINGLGGVRYAFLLVLAAVFAEKLPKIMDEPLSFWPVFRKTAAASFIILGVLIALIRPADTPGVKIWGVDYSSLYANQLGLDSRKVFAEIVNDLKVKNFRLSAHWPEIEKIEGRYDFGELDFQIREVEKAGGKIILAVGKRLPRWPECHEPERVKQLTTNDQQQFLLKYIEAVINRYKDNSAVWAWQVENEPFLWGFGECPYVDDEFLDEEIALVRKLGGQRPIILTDGGEFGRWFRAYKRADIFGTTMYRLVWSRFASGDGYFKYPLEPEYFKIKAKIMETIFGKKPVINIELQAEPWLIKRPPDVPLEEQLKVFGVSQFRENIEYAREVGFEQNYLWGAEWWYWMKEKQNHPEFWEEAKRLYDE